MQQRRPLGFDLHFGSFRMRNRGFFARFRMRIEDFDHVLLDSC